MKTDRTKSAAPSPVWMSFATFDHPTDAREFKTLIKKEGIDAEINDERKMQKRWMKAKPEAGVHVEIQEPDLLRARRIVKQSPGLEAAYQKAVHCPECKSSRVQYPQMTRKNFLPTILAKVLVKVGAMEHECYCEDCHHTWVRNKEAKKTRARSPRRRSVVRTPASQAG
jgi:hypothetical protein